MATVRVQPAAGALDPADSAAAACARARPRYRRGGRDLDIRDASATAGTPTDLVPGIRPGAESDARGGELAVETGHAGPARPGQGPAGVSGPRPARGPAEPLTCRDCGSDSTLRRGRECRSGRRGRSSTPQPRRWRPQLAPVAARKRRQIPRRRETDFGEGPEREKEGWRVGGWMEAGKGEGGECGSVDGSVGRWVGG